MNVLVACEESQAVTIEMRKLGHNAFSCDLQECSGGHPEWHIKGDAVEALVHRNGYVTTMDGVKHYIPHEWDLLIAHPPCTYLSNAGACRLYPKSGEIDIERYNKGLDAKAFFENFYFSEAHAKRIAIENPIPSRIFNLPEKTQAIQPYEYGDPYTKKTYLWLKNLPPLIPTKIVKPLGPYVCGNSEIWKKQRQSGIVYGKEKSAKHRSKTFPGIAKAMAEQWAGPNFDTWDRWEQIPIEDYRKEHKE